jgi:hypothetical protein
VVKIRDVVLQPLFALVNTGQIENLAAMLGGKAKRAGLCGLFTGQRN